MAEHNYATTASAQEARTVHGPVAGIYFPFEAASVGTDTVFDLRSLAGKYVRITVEDVDMLYVFGPTATSAMDVGFHSSLTQLVPDIIGAGFSVREVVPPDCPYLLCRGATGTTPGAVRVRRA